MFCQNPLQGDRVRLTAFDATDVPILAQWYQQFEFLQLLDARPAYPQSEELIRQWLDERQQAKDGFIFAVRPTLAPPAEQPAPLASDTLLGYVELEGILWNQGVSWVSLAIGREYQRQGYGYAALQLALAFAFQELNLHRLQLTVFSYNQPAIALYEKLGFKREGVYREFVQRQGDRHDMYLYGLLGHEWQAQRSTGESTGVTGISKRRNGC
jgi:RimJ/RimL family protein N-acetyltransferase